MKTRFLRGTQAALAGGLRSEEGPINYNASELSLERYTPGSIRQLGVR